MNSPELDSKVKYTWIVSGCIPLSDVYSPPDLLMQYFISLPSAFVFLYPNSGLIIHLFLNILIGMMFTLVRDMR